MARRTDLAAYNAILTFTCFLLSLAVPAAAKPRANHAPIVLDDHTTILRSSNEPQPIQDATADLANDFEKVTGTRPRIVDRVEDAGPVTILVGEQPKLPEQLRTATLTAPESFSVSVARAYWNKRSKVVLLTGADMRGTIYAVYEFSQKYLGVDPMYYWTDNEPERHASIEIPAALDQTYPPPVFKYRGFFTNDEDLLTGWAPGEEKDKSGISLEVWNKIYETILRLKGNMVAPGTWIFPDDPQVRLAAKRGLIVAQHHATPLGMNVARWPKDVPYNYSTHPEILERAWKNAVNEYLPNQEVVWSVGLRGLSDISYASMDPSVRDNNQALGELISKAIATQIDIVRTSHPDAHFIANLWQEGSRLAHEGFLKIPPEVATVWADDGYGYLQDHGEVAKGEGAYDHVAMMNLHANQLSELVPIERSFSEMGRYIKAGATDYYLVNTSDIRPVIMSARAVMNVAWKGVPSGGADEFYREWATEEFGKEAAPQIVGLYKDYYNAPARSGNPVHEYGDQLYHTEARRMLLAYMIDYPLFSIPSQSPKWELPRPVGFGFQASPRPEKDWLHQTIARESQQCSDAQPRWDALWKKAVGLEAQVPEARRPFYHAQVLAMIAINRESNRILYLVAKAIQDAENGNKAAAKDEAAQALGAFDEIQQAESAAEYGKWKNWYRGDWLTGIYRTRQLVEIFSQFLDDPETHIAPPVLWDGWEAYYHIMHYEGERSVDVR